MVKSSTIQYGTVQYSTDWYSTVHFNTVQYTEQTSILPWEKCVQRANKLKGQNVIEIYLRLGPLKTHSHLILLTDEGLSCFE